MVDNERSEARINLDKSIAETKVAVPQDRAQKEIETLTSAVLVGIADREKPRMKIVLVYPQAREQQIGLQWGAVFDVKKEVRV